MWLLDGSRIEAASVRVLDRLDRRRTLALHVRGGGRVSTGLAHKVICLQHMSHAAVVRLVRVCGGLQLGRRV